jgi:hypothetical protein
LCDNSPLSGRYCGCNDDLADDSVLADDNALTRKSLENSPVPIETISLEPLVPDDAVPGFDPPPV